MLTAASLSKFERLGTERGTAFRFCFKFACDSIKAIFSGVITGEKPKTAAFNYKQWEERIIYARLPLSESIYVGDKGACKSLLQSYAGISCLLRARHLSGKSHANLALGCPGSGSARSLIIASDRTALWVSIVKRRECLDAQKRPGNFPFLWITELQRQQEMRGGLYKLPGAVGGA